MNDFNSNMPPYKRSRRNALKPNSTEYEALQDFSLQRCLDNSSISTKNNFTVEPNNLYNDNSINQKIINEDNYDSLYSNNHSIFKISRETREKIKDEINENTTYQIQETIKEILSNLVDILEINHNHDQIKYS